MLLLEVYVYGCIIYSCSREPSGSLDIEVGNEHNKASRQQRDFLLLIVCMNVRLCEPQRGNPVRHLLDRSGLLRASQRRCDGRKKR